jgi:tetratricopeptide (TPR) repeat protein
MNLRLHPLQSISGVAFRGQTTRLERLPDLKSSVDSKTGFVEQINVRLRSGQYSRALDLLRASTAEFPNDAELSELEKRAQDGIERNTEAQRLITESQELFSQQKSPEAIELLRRAYELDKKNSLARAILANALVEHAQSLVETDWLEAEKLTNQALAVNPAHPTAKTILNLIVEKKETSSAEDWVSHASSLHSSGDLFGALAWVAEGLAVHPNDPKLLQIQDAIQRDQGARRRQARRQDLEDLRRMALEIDGAADVAAKQALSERIQALAARYWTDGEILSIANALLLRLGLIPKSSNASPHGPGAPVIFHVPRSSPAKPAVIETTRISSGNVPPPIPALPSTLPSPKTPPGNASTASVSAGEVQSNIVREEQTKVPPPISEPLLPTPQPVVTEPSAPVIKVTPPSPQPKPLVTSNFRSNFGRLILVSSVAAILIAAIFFFISRNHAPQALKTTVAPISAEPTVLETTTSRPAPPAPVSPAAEPIPEPSLPVVSDAGAGKVTPPEASIPDAPPVESPHNLNTPKSAVQNPPLQAVRIRKDEPAKPITNPQPLPRLASLTIQGGVPGTAVLVDQILVGVIQADGTLSISSVNPGDHTVELRKDRFKPRQQKEHFSAGGTISLSAADAALETAPSELKINFTPADANVAIAKGDLLKMVSSGVALNLAPGTYTLTARTAERFTRSSTVEVIAGQSKTLDLSLAPNGMSKWDDPGAWKQEKDSFTRKGGDFVLYGAVPASGTFVFSATPMKGRLLQWVLNYTDPKNYVLYQMDDNNFYRTVIRNGEKKDRIIIPDQGDKKKFRTLQIRVSATDLVHQIKHGDSWTVLDHWTQPGANVSLGKFGFYLPGNDQVALSGFAHYADLNIR